MKLNTCIFITLVVLNHLWIWWLLYPLIHQRNTEERLVTVEKTLVLIRHNLLKLYEVQYLQEEYIKNLKQLQNGEFQRNYITSTLLITSNRRLHCQGTIFRRENTTYVATSYHCIFKDLNEDNSTLYDIKFVDSKGESFDLSSFSGYFTKKDYDVIVFEVKRDKSFNNFKIPEISTEDSQIGEEIFGFYRYYNDTSHITLLYGRILDIFKSYISSDIYGFKGFSGAGLFDLNGRLKYILKGKSGIYFQDQRTEEILIDRILRIIKFSSNLTLDKFLDIGGEEMTDYIDLKLNNMIDLLPIYKVMSSPKKEFSSKKDDLF